MWKGFRLLDCLAQRPENEVFSHQRCEYYLFVAATKANFIKYFFPRELKMVLRFFKSIAYMLGEHVVIIQNHTGRK